MPKMALPNLSFFRDDFRMTTLLLTGAAIQCLLFILIPTYVALLPASLLITARIATFILISHGILHDPSFDNVKLGRLTAQIPFRDGSAPEKAGEKEVVILVLGARSNQYVPKDFQPYINTNASISPRGRFAPGYVEVGHLFRRMWQDAAKNREKWGCQFPVPTMNPPIMLGLADMTRSREILHPPRYGP